MTNFLPFFSAILNAIAEFLWLDALRWITAMILLLGIAVFIKKLVR